jgi:hypothetical protein
MRLVCLMENHACRLHLHMGSAVPCCSCTNSLWIEQALGRRKALAVPSRIRSRAAHMHNYESSVFSVNETHGTNLTIEPTQS